ncbi:BTB/POZ domain-containing protein isoform X2 [Tasmannia lanceolata]|uniref:BTB/POZ domain-containing protein isoform X2 n=1 Tax=Tasmannia lanceolata TaxID=3420 RepID=UPI004063F41B
MESQYPKSHSYSSANNSSMKMGIPPDNDRSSGELRALDCNLTALCDHIQMEGFDSGSFSDLVIQAMGSTYHLHRLILSRSSYFRNMLHGPWKEANAPMVTLHIDDDNVNPEAIAIALAYLYGHHPKLNDSNAFRVLAAASFLDLQDLCAICTDFIISELWTSNFLAYQVFAESQDYGIHGERVRSACWGYLCQSGTTELREVLPKLSSQTLHALLTSDELWVPSEEKRFELALCTLLAKGAFLKADHPEQTSSASETGGGVPPDLSVLKGKNLIGGSTSKQPIETGLGHLNLLDNLDGHATARNILVELADCVVDFHAGVSNSKPLQMQQETCSEPVLDSRYSCKMEQSNSFSDTDAIRTSRAYVEMRNGIEANRMGSNEASMEGPSEERTCYHLNNNNNNIWISRDQSKPGSSATSCNEVMPNDWGRCSMPPHSWGGRIVGRRQVKSYSKVNCGIHSEEYDAFMNIFEGGSLLYCNMSFEALLNVRKQLEELGFPGKAVNDGLWLQMLLNHKVQEIGIDTCKNCCLTSMSCACRQPYGFSHGGTTGYYRQDYDRNSGPGNVGNVYLADAQGEGNGLFGPVRVHVRGPIDGLAGIGRGTTFVPAAAWPPTRFVFSRVPFGLGNRNCQQSLANDESEARADLNGDLSGDGLTALVGLSQGNSAIPGHAEQTERAFEPELQCRLAGASVSVPSSSGIPVQMLESQEHSLGIDWENAEGSSISLDMKTPLRHFPPFRFGVEFEDVHRLMDGQVKHSPEIFYAGSLWKVSVQAFNDEDPQGRRTLDSREKVTARYQLICPSKREVMFFGSFKQPGTLLPKAPKGWGWRTALLFDELSDLLQGGALRVSAVVQLV